MKIVAGCGEVFNNENCVCPYFSDHENWVKHHGKYGPCEIDLQVGSNVCLYTVKLSEEV